MQTPKQENALPARSVIIRFSKHLHPTTPQLSWQHTTTDDIENLEATGLAKASSQESGPSCMLGGFWAQLACVSAELLSLPLLIEQSSRTSSCTRLAVWIISVISASRRCLSVMSLQHATDVYQRFNCAMTVAGVKNESAGLCHITAIRGTSQQAKRKHDCKVRCSNEFGVPEPVWAQNIIA